jgi:outer membrane protein assembly factor BamB
MIRLLFCAFIGFAIAGCSTNSGHVKAELKEFDARYLLKRDWAKGVDSISRAQMQVSIYKSAVFAASDSGDVSSFSLDSGKKRWSRDVGAELSAGVGVGDDIVVVGTLDGDLIALNAEDGAEVWKHALAREVVAPPTISSGYVIAHSGDGRVTALSAKDGKPAWYFDQDVPALSIRGAGQSAEVSGAVAVGFANGRLAMFILESGEMIWEQQIAIPRGRSEISRLVDVDASPLVYGRTMFVASYGKEIVALDLRSGETRWKKDIGTYRDMMVDGQLLFVSDIEGHVWALDRRNGQTVWETDELLGRYLTNPVAINGQVIVGDVDGYLHILSREDGKVIGRLSYDDEPFSGNLRVEDDQLVVLSREGNLASYNLSEIVNK